MELINEQVAALSSKPTSNCGVVTEQLRREERELEMMQVKDMLKSFQEEVLGRLGNVENEVTAMKDAVATHTSLVESLQSVRWRWCIPADAEAYI